jgi:hypothetical protein
VSTISFKLWLRIEQGQNCLELNVGKIFEYCWWFYYLYDRLDETYTGQTNNNEYVSLMAGQKYITDYVLVENDNW